MNQGLEAESPNTVHFADDNARESWEISEKISEIETELPPEGHPLNLSRIEFENEDKRRGLNAVFNAGKVVSAGKGIHVPARTLKILDLLGIKYRIL